MKISYQWLRELSGLDWSPDEMGDRLTLAGTACEYITPTAEYMRDVIVGQVVELSAIEGADKIKKAVVDTGSDTVEVVCGAPNVAEGQKIAFAGIGAKLVDDFVIKKVKIRGVESVGMICSERELGISDDHAGIIVLDDDAPVGGSLVEYLDYDDQMLTFELTPNRGDSMSAIGIARDLVALASIKLNRPDSQVAEGSAVASDYIKVSIDDVDACPRYAARVIKGVQIAPSPWWLRKRLLASGVRPISNIVDITNLVMLECGHPLHAFDLDRFGSNEVVVRRAREGEKFATLDGREHSLDEQVLLITNGKEGVAAGGVMGGLNSEVEDGTTNILLEAAYFNPSMIRKSRRKLDTVSESSQRFEKGVDPNGIRYALDRAAQLMHKLCGGEVAQGIVDCYPTRIEPRVIELRPERCNAVLGSNYTTERMKQILTDLELNVQGDGPLTVTAPTFRPDLEKEIDLIEEVVRIEGFESIDDAINCIGPLFTRRLPEDRFEDEARAVLTACGFDEMLDHGLSHSKLATLFNPDLPQVRILNPVSEELDIMRNSLVPTTLAAVAHNLSHRVMDVCLFELGKAFFSGMSDNDWREEDRLVLAVTGSSPQGWRQTSRPYDFHDLAGALDSLAEHFRWSRFSYGPEPVSFLDDKLSFRLLQGKRKVGWVGRVAADKARRMGIKQP
ncbi:MAG: phenylalanine--tRNA ligase subunit beta, partial [candidate division Zixibacteria bacterium]|nr:phenylalanine--tRNA ligase subunit beta [candidate division Zixibacteria bacterium]